LSPEVPESSQPTPAPEKSVAVVQALPPLPPVRAPEAAALSTIDLLKPQDRLRDAIEAFLLDQRSVHTRRSYGKDLKRFVQYLHGRAAGFGPEALDRLVIVAYKEYLLADGLEHSTVDRHLSTLRSFFGWLVNDGLLEKNPAEGVRFLNPRRLSRTIGFTDEEVQRVLKAPDLHTRTGSLHYAILMTLFHCGLRRSEVCALRTSSLAIERGHHVLRLLGKGNAERIVVLIPAVWHAFEHYFRITARDIARDAPLFLPIRNNRTGVREKPLDPSHIFYIVTKYAKVAGVANRVSPHSCRATAISNARDHHVPDRAIQEFAGWTTTDMITRYDKRRTSVEESASHAIAYGAEDRAAAPVPRPELSTFRRSETE
jgi:integrase/recombinase XerD